MERTLIVLAALAVCAVVGDDLTVENRATGAEVVEATLDIIDETCIFSDNKLLMRRIAKVETDDGTADDTFEDDGTPVPGGIWRADENKLRDITTSASTDMLDAIEEVFGIDWSTVTTEDMGIPLYSALAARLWIESNPTLGYEVPWSGVEQAEYWVSTYQSGAEVVVDDFLQASATLDTACDSNKADIVFVLDGSGSIGSDNFDTMKDFVESVIDTFDISDDGVHVGVIQYSSESDTEFYMGEINDMETMKTEVQNIDYKKGTTNTAAGLDDLREMFATYGRSGVPQLSIVMTDGISNDASKTADAAQMVHDEQVTVFAVGVTDGALLEELQAIGTDPDCVHVFVLDTFDDITPFTSKIQQQACRAPAVLLPEEDFDGEVETGKRVFFKLKIKKNKKGLTIKLKVRSGGTRLFVSFKARNPGRAVFKYQLRVDSSARDGGRMYIPFPDEEDLYGAAASLDEMDVFAALLGEGVGQQNAFTMGMSDGELSGGTGNAAAPAIMGLMLLLASMLVN